MPLILLNPVLELSKDRESESEGCLSFPEMSAEITRASGVRCRAKRLDGEEIIFEAFGLLARALQHEVDHLHGVLFIDRMNSSAKASVAGRLKRLQKKIRRA
jgi:peptide deformylase